MKRSDLKLSEFAKILERICEALDAAHARRIIHRDIKPANILFDIDGSAFLADFGIAKIRSEADEEDEWLVGTPNYMSPEQWLDNKLDGRTDVYALGVVLYQILTGMLPFEGISNDRLMDLHMNQPVPLVSQAQPDLSEAWDEIVSKAMAKSPDERYSRAGELAQDVQDLVSGRWFWRKL